MEENLEVLYQQGAEVSNAQIKGMEKRKMNLEVRLKELLHEIETRKDDVADFKRMGIDHLFVDESHRFKNLMFTTRHDRVAGLGNSEGSQRALNMLFALRTIQQRTGKDLGATFLSGTTISNSLTELYLLFKYLRPGNWSVRGSTPLTHGRRCLPGSPSITSSPSPTRWCRKSVSATSSRFRNSLRSIPRSPTSVPQPTSASTVRRRTRYCTTYPRRPTRGSSYRSSSSSPRPAMPPYWAARH